MSYPYSIAYQTGDFSESQKLTICLALDQVLNVPRDHDEKQSVLYSLFSHDLLFRKFRIAIITEQFDIAKTRKALLKWLAVDELDVNYPLALFMCPNDEHDEYLIKDMKAATVEQINPLVYVDSDADILSNARLQSVPIKLHYDSNVESNTTTEYFILSVLEAIEQC